MQKIRYAVIGSGWRSLFYGRIAQALPQQFELTALYCRTEEKAARLQQEYGLPATSREADVADSRPDFVVSAVSKQNMAPVVRQWLDRGFGVLSETPAALTREELDTLWRMQQAGARVQVAEQYRFYPYYTAVLRLMDSGLLGEPVSAYLSAMHDYHAAGMLRGLLGLGREEFRVTGNTFRVPVTDTRTRTEVLTEGRVVMKEQRQALFEYESGRTGSYDFMSDQYRSPIRPRTLRLRGTRGELDGREVCWLNQANLPEWDTLDIRQDPSGEVLGITFRGRELYAPLFGRCGLPEDETAIARMLVGMKRYMETGEEIYPLADALEDAYTALLMTSPAVTPGTGLEQETTGQGLSGGWYQRQSGPRIWK